MPRLLLLLIALLPFYASGAYAASAEDAREFVDSLGQKVLNIVDAPGDKEQRQKQLEQMFVENVDIDWMGKFVLGHAWQQANDDQRQHYMQAYRDYLLAHYTSNFADYNGSKYKITSVTDQGNGEFNVAMQINTPQAKDTQAGYRVRNAGNGFKISDIIVEGVSLITTERSEFSSIVQSSGMDGLIAALESKRREEEKKAENYPWLMAFLFVKAG